VGGGGKNESTDRVLAILLHGDAAFSGQGIVPETMELSNLPSFTTGGTVHVVINNMIGFTTDPRASRSSYHCTDVAKGIQAPIFHVNGDDVEAVVSVCQLAAEYRQTFHKDCVVDIVCYRRHGHNELDEPSLTQPLTYRLIADHPPVLQIYTEALLSSGVIDTEYARNISQSVLKEFEKQYQESAAEVKKEAWLASNWQGDAINAMTDAGKRPYNPTGVRIETLRSICEAITRIPEGFNAHPTVVKLFKDRREQFKKGSIDMALAEQLAFGALMLPYSKVTIVQHMPSLS
jgi:2-oxoglutarate dehydrogenase E1 component